MVTCYILCVFLKLSCNCFQFFQQPYFSALGTLLRKLFAGAFSSTVREVNAKSVRALSRCFGMKFLWIEIRYVKTGQSWCSALICRKWSAFEMQFRLIVVSIFLRWLNTVLGAVSGTNKHGGEKSNGTQKTIAQNLLIKILWYLAEFWLLSYSK